MIGSPIKYCTVHRKFTSISIATVNFKFTLLWFSRLPWTCIPGALLTHMNKVVVTLAVLKDNLWNQLQSRTEKANALTGAQLYFSCMEEILADAFANKTVASLHSMQDISAGTAHGLQKSHWKNPECYREVLWGKIQILLPCGFFMKLLLFSKRRNFSPSVENKSYFCCS